MRLDRRARTLLLALVLVGAAIYHYWGRPRPTATGTSASGSAVTATSAAPKRATSSASAAPVAPRPLTLTRAALARDPKAAFGAFEARVLARATGAPIARASIWIEQAGQKQELVTNERGEVVFEPKAEAPVAIESVSAKGYETLEAPPGSLAFVPRSGQRVRDVVLYLEPTVDCAGVVRDEAKVPIPAATLRVFSETTGERREELTADGEGKFVLKRGLGATLEVRKLGFATRRVSTTPRSSGFCSLVVVLARGRAHGAIRGHVTGADGSTAGMAIRALGEDGDARFGAAAITEVDPKGDFAFTELDDTTTYRLVVRHPAGSGEVLHVATGREDVALALTHGSRVTGTVRDKRGGAPIPAFSVVAMRKLGPIEREEAATLSVFDATGAFELRDLAPGDYVFSVVAAGFGPSVATPATVGDAAPTALAFELDRGGKLTGVVTDRATKKPIEGASVTAVGGGAASRGTSESALTDARGAFEITGLGKGLRSLEVEAKDHDGRILSGLVVPDGGDLGPIAIDLAPVAPGEDPKMELVGIGAVLAAKDDALVIGNVIDGGGAAAAGLGKGDGILAVDGSTVVDLGFEDAIQKIRGPEGSTVVLIVRKASGGEPATIPVVRRKLRG